MAHILSTLSERGEDEEDAAHVGEHWTMLRLMAQHPVYCQTAAGGTVLGEDPKERGGPCGGLPACTVSAIRRGTLRREQSRLPHIFGVRHHWCDVRPPMDPQPRTSRSVRAGWGLAGEGGRPDLRRARHPHAGHAEVPGPRRAGGRRPAPPHPPLSRRRGAGRPPPRSQVRSRGRPGGHCTSRRQLPPAWWRRARRLRCRANACPVRANRAGATPGLRGRCWPR